MLSLNKTRFLLATTALVAALQAQGANDEKPEENRKRVARTAVPGKDEQPAKRPAPTRELTPLPPLPPAPSFSLMGAKPTPQPAPQPAYFEEEVLMAGHAPTTTTTTTTTTIQTAQPITTHPDNQTGQILSQIRNGVNIQENIRILQGMNTDTARYALAALMVTGAGTIPQNIPQNTTEGLRLLREGAAQNNPLALNNLGMLMIYQKHGFTAADRTVGMTHIQAAAEAGYVGAQANLGTWMVMGQQGFEKTDANRKEGLRLLKLAADQGSAAAQGCLGCCMVTGQQGFEKTDANQREGLRLLKLAADQGNEPAQGYLGYCMVTGQQGFEKTDANRKEGLRLLKLAADQGSAPAKNMLARLQNTPQQHLRPAPAPVQPQPAPVPAQDPAMEEIDPELARLHRARNKKEPEHFQDRLDYALILINDPNRALRAGIEPGERGYSYTGHYNLNILVNSYKYAPALYARYNGRTAASHRIEDLMEAARQGYAPAQAQLAQVAPVRHTIATQTEPTPTESVTITNLILQATLPATREGALAQLNTLATQNHPDALYTLGLWMVNGLQGYDNTIDATVRQGWGFMNRAANLGHKDAKNLNTRGKK